MDAQLLKSLHLQFYEPTRAFQVQGEVCAWIAVLRILEAFCRVREWVREFSLSLDAFDIVEEYINNGDFLSSSSFSCFLKEHIYRRLSIESFTGIALVKRQRICSETGIVFSVTFDKQVQISS